MRDLIFPRYTYKSFTPNELVYTEDETLKELRRYDYINLTNMAKKERNDFLKSTYNNYLEDLKKGFEYKDYICNRYYLKEFVLRDTGYFSDDETEDIRFFKYKIYGNIKVFGGDTYKDERCLRIDIYTLHDNILEKDSKCIIKIGHKNELIDQLSNYIQIPVKDRNYYVIPMYINTVKTGNKFVRVSDESRYWSDEDFETVIGIIDQALIRFASLNHYMITMYEDNIPVDGLTNSGNYEHYDSIIEYVKSKAVADKHVKVKIADNAVLSIKKDNNNVYDHDNIITKRLCDYKFLVNAHYQGYWYGKRGSTERVKKYVWKESYYKNKNKPFRIIKERQVVED